jgi:PUA domain protein
MIMTSQNHLNVVVLNNEPLFFQVRDGPYYPTLHLLHKCKCKKLIHSLMHNVDPFLLPQMQVDRGAIKYVLSGANIMSPGLTSPGGKMVDVPEGTAVVKFCNYAQ